MRKEIVNVENVSTIENIRWFAIVGDNGLGFTSSEGVVLEGLQLLKNVTVMQMPSLDAARNYSFNAYASRFLMRNFHAGVYPIVPINLSADYIFVDPDFERREGQKTVGYFPALLL